jgi:hypothetical protein
MMVKRCDRCDVEQTMKQMVSGWMTITVYPQRERAGVMSEMEHLDLCPRCSTAVQMIVRERPSG